MIDFTPAALAALQKDNLRVSPLLRIASDPVIRIWSGVGDLATAGDAFDPDGAVYQGLGVMGALPQLSQLINGVADRINLSLSGINADVMAKVADDSKSVKNKETAIGISIFDDDWQITQAPVWLYLGVCDFPAVSQQSSEGLQVRSVSLSVGSLFTGRRRPGYSYWTDADQQARSPGDKFCERTVRMAILAAKIWPRL